MVEEDDLIARARARVGAVLCGKYQLVALIGVGGMASVYAAKHLRNANRVAVKVLRPEISVDPVLRSRFLREGYAANSVGHPGTVRVLDDDRAEDGSVFLVMELLEGETLAARCARCGHSLPAPEVVSIGRQLLVVLHAAHGKGIVHRDIKPENVFLTRDGALKVLDFGVARLREASPQQTRTGAVFGTPAFMPPEQAIGRTREVDALSDVWAVGATLFTLLSGRLVHEAETAQEMLVCAATRPARSLASVAPGAPPSLVAVVDRALAFDKKDRWPSALAMAEALETVPTGEPSAASVAPPAPDRETTDVPTLPRGTVPEPAAPVGLGLETTVAAAPDAGGATVGGVSSRSVGARRTRPAVVAAAVGLTAALAVATALLAGQRQSPAPLSSSAAATPRPPTAPAATRPDTAASIPSTTPPPSARPAPPTIAVSALPSVPRRAPPARRATSTPPSVRDPLAPKPPSVHDPLAP